MRRVGTVLAVAVGLPVWALGVPAAALAQDATPTPAAEEAPPPAAGEQVCPITDFRLIELSGLVAIEDGYVVVNDGTDFFDRQPVFFLDGTCAVVNQIGFPTVPLDPEDLAIDHSDGTLWVADTGDNNAAVSGTDTRPTVALWRIPPEGDRTPVIHRLAYPDGPRDAEALLLAADGTPIIITKRLGSAELYTPAEPLRENNPPEDPVPLQLAGEFTPPPTDTEHPLGAIARQVITGAASAPDGSRVVLRTYTDAFEFDVVDGDVVAAVTTTEPRITALPDEPQGEAITYTPDGESFLTVSETVEQPENVTPALLRYTPAPPAPPPDPEQPADTGGSAGGGRSFFDRLLNPTSLQDYINIIAAVGLLGLIMVGVGVFGIVRARRSPGGQPGGVPRGAGPGGGGIGTAVVSPESRITGRATARGTATAPGARPDDRPPDVAGQRPAGVYTSSAATGYAEAEPGFGTPGRGGRTYGGGYPDQPISPAHPDEYRGREYGGGEYRGGGYAPEDPRGRYEVDRYHDDAGYGQPPAGGPYAGRREGYAGAAPPVSDGSGGYYPEDWSGYSGPGQPHPDVAGYPYRYGEPGPEHR